MRFVSTAVSVLVVASVAACSADLAPPEPTSEISSPLTAVGKPLPAPAPVPDTATCEDGHKLVSLPGTCNYVLTGVTYTKDAFTATCACAFTSVAPSCPSNTTPATETGDVRPACAPSVSTVNAPYRDILDDVGNPVDVQTICANACAGQSGPGTLPTANPLLCCEPAPKSVPTGPGTPASEN